MVAIMNYFINQNMLQQNYVTASEIIFLSEYSAGAKHKSFT